MNTPNTRRSITYYQRESARNAERTTQRNKVFEKALKYIQPESLAIVLRAEYYRLK